MGTLDYILNGLIDRYKKRVPDVSVIISELLSKSIIANENDIENDHIAFRTMGVSNLGVNSFEKIFLHYGYTVKDSYDFVNKKVSAKWYAPPKNHYPRIFVSELRVHDLPLETQEIILSYTNEVKEDPVDKLDLDNGSQVDNYLHSSLWRTPTWSDYKKLLDVSEYAAWVIYNRYYLNHYTMNVNTMPKGYNTLPEFNHFLNSIGVLLSNAGGEIKTSKDGLLLQSSTVSQLVEAIFADGQKHKISGSYVEFVERKVLLEYQNLSLDEIKRHHRREGFEAGNADKIFESTFTSQTKRKPNSK